VKKKILPVYDISDFRYLGTEDDFYANDFRSHLNQHHNFILAPHKHNFYLSVLFTRGSGTHEIEFDRFDIKPGRIFMLSPGKVHTWQLSKDIDGYILFHTREFYDFNFTYDKVENYPFFSSLRNSPLIALNRTDLKKLEPVFKEVVEEYRENELMKFQKIGSLMNVLYIELARKYLPQQLREKRNLNFLAKVKKFEDLVDSNFKTVKSPKEYAKMMFISERHLNRLCKISLNKTITELITERIILEAKRMLVFSKDSVSEIISQLGYTDSSYFFRLFKKKTTLTPLEFKNKFS
jgi:AraC family transcriptional regulator, transcriptional activator of pobA